MINYSDQVSSQTEIYKIFDANIMLSNICFDRNIISILKSTIFEKWFDLLFNKLLLTGEVLQNVFYIVH